MVAVLLLLVLKQLLHTVSYSVREERRGQGWYSSELTTETTRTQRASAHTLASGGSAAAAIAI